MGSSYKLLTDRHSAPWLILLLMIGGIFLQFSHLIRGLGNQQVIEAWADGFKTYMNAWYHAKYGNQLLHFEGMNYPFGEPLFQATELPGLAMLLQGLQPLFPDIGTHTITIVHLILLGGLLLSGLLLFRLFNRLGASLPAALAGAYTLTFLSPCLLRMYSHYGLAQPYLIPLVFLLLLGFQRQRHWVYSLGLCLTVIGGAFLHFYFFSICLLTIGIYGCCLLWMDSSLRQRRNTLLHLLFIAGVPILVFYFLLFLNDPVPDRSPSPYGFFKFRATLPGFLINTAHPLGRFMLDNSPDLPKIESESEVYLGLLTLLSLFLLGINAVLGLIGRRFLPKIFDGHPGLFPLFCTGLLVGLFAMGFPFMLPGCEDLLAYTGPLKQFRSLGRFGWVTFYSFGILAFTAWDRWLRQQPKKWIRLSIMAFLAVLLLTDLYYFTKKAPLPLQEVHNFTTGIRFDALEGINWADYQATLPIPYFNIGSNNFIIRGSGFALQKSLLIATQTGVPTTGAMLARSSRRQSMLQAQLVKPICTMPALFSAFPNSKPLLLFWDRRLSPETAAPYRHLQEMGTLVIQEKNFELYRLELNAFQSLLCQKQEDLRTAYDTGRLYRHGAVQTDGRERDFLYRDFDATAAGAVFEGRGSYGGRMDAENLILDAPLPNGQADSSYQFSIWAYVDGDRLTSNMFRLREVSPDGRTLQEIPIHTWMNAVTIDPKGWVLVEKQFRLKEAESRLQLRFGRDRMEGRTTYVDQLLIRPNHRTVFLETPERLYRNNWFFAP